MKYMIQMTIPNPIGNKLVEDPTFIRKLKEYVENTKAESAYFTLKDGKRTAIFVMDRDSPKQMYDACEPLPLLGGRVNREMIMTFEDINSGSATQG